MANASGGVIPGLYASVPSCCPNLCRERWEAYHPITWFSGTLFGPRWEFHVIRGIEITLQSYWI